MKTKTRIYFFTFTFTFPYLQGIPKVFLFPNRHRTFTISI